MTKVIHRGYKMHITSKEAPVNAQCHGSTVPNMSLSTPL